MTCGKPPLVIGWSITTSALVVWQLTSLRLGEQVCRLCDYFSPKVDEYERLITDNPIFRRRVEVWAPLAAKTRLMGALWSHVTWVWRELG